MVLGGERGLRAPPAAALTALARHTLRTAAELLPDPLDAVARLNHVLVTRARQSLCTVAAALLTEHDGEAVAEIICAGHPPPLMVAEGRVLPVGHFGPMLGAFDGQHWERVTVTVPPGALLVLYTDGVLDTVGAGRERFGETRLQAVVGQAADADAVVERVRTALEAFEVGNQADDTAVLAVQRVGVPGAVRSPDITGSQRA